MEDVEAWARMLLALDRFTDDIAGERDAVLEWIDAELHPKESDADEAET